MTRKRFVKLLRSKGYNRKAIDAMVRRVAEKNLSYADTYLQISRVQRMFINLLDAFRESMLKANMAIKSLGKAMMKIGEDGNLKWQSVCQSCHRSIRPRLYENGGSSKQNQNQ